MSKKDKRRAKQAQKEKADPLLKCNVCNVQFDSRSKLMKHINATGHARA
jgi:hypothetical protein